MSEFADFLAPFDAQTFRADYYGKRPLHIRREGGARPLNWRRFNDVLAIAPPLVIAQPALERAFDVLEATLDAIE